MFGTAVNPPRCKHYFLQMCMPIFDSLVPVLVVALARVCSASCVHTCAAAACVSNVHVYITALCTLLLNALLPLVPTGVAHKVTRQLLPLGYTLCAPLRTIRSNTSAPVVFLVNYPRTMCDYSVCACFPPGTAIVVKAPAGTQSFGPLLHGLTHISVNIDVGGQYEPVKEAIASALARGQNVLAFVEDPGKRSASLSFGPIRRSVVCMVSQIGSLCVPVCIAYPRIGKFSDPTDLRWSAGRPQTIPDPDIFIGKLCRFFLRAERKLRN